MGIRLKTYPKQSWEFEGTTNHWELNGREESDQHPIWAITDLEDILINLQASITELENKQVPWPSFNDTASIALDHDTENETVTADLIISEAGDNAIQILQDGVYVQNFSSQVDELTEMIQIVAENANSSGSTIKVMQNNHGLSVGNIVYCDNTGKYKKALAEDTIKIEALGIVTEVTDANNFVLTLSGMFETDIYNSLGYGVVMYLSEQTAGTYTTTPQIYNKPIATRVPKGIIINIQRGDIFHSEGVNITSYYDKTHIDEIVEEIMENIRGIDYRNTIVGCSEEEVIEICNRCIASAASASTQEEQ